MQILGIKNTVFLAFYTRFWGIDQIHFCKFLVSNLQFRVKMYLKGRVKAWQNIKKTLRG